MIPRRAQWVKGPSIAAAAALIESLAQELLYALSVAKGRKEGRKDVFCFQIIADKINDKESLQYSVSGSPEFVEGRIECSLVSG